MTIPGRLHPLLDEQAERLVERVDLQRRRRVVIGRRPLDPVLREQLEIEREERGVLASTDPLERAPGKRHGREARRGTEALLAARERVVDPPGLRRNLNPAQRGDAVDEEE